MKLCVLAVLAHVLVIFSLASGASIDRYESEKPAQTTVIHLLHTPEALNDRRPTNDSKHQEDDRQEDEEEYYYDDDEQDEYELSGDFEMPQVAFSSKPKDPSTVLNAERRVGEENERKGKGQKKGKGKGKGKKRNPCLKKYKDYCIHGTCQYVRKLGPLCICDKDYLGDSSQVSQTRHVRCRKRGEGQAWHVYTSLNHRSSRVAVKSVKFYLKIK
ncbi:hypothetical protein AMELA_G00009890 [Ameiurus melas]|uniref:Uncharacterized protein n=1 Tax=Ameiurus melas TaxID=219545 RepID=A0A7J6BGC9_AMEME|nr:hypothetical protein AMELA_G00009890 [Ameiurus melas]